MIAYACNPDGVGEQWLGWEWAVQAAKRYRVTLLTIPRWREPIEREAPAHGIEVHFVELSPLVRRLFARITRNDNVIHQLLWQREILPLAERLHRQDPFVLVHQTTFHSFRVPFAASALPIPSLWGPFAGGESVPKGFGPFLGSKARIEAVRHCLNRPWLRHPAIQRSLRQATALWVSNGVTHRFLPPEFQAKATIVPPNALRAADALAPERPHPSPATDRPLSLLYMGSCVATRAIPLIFAALAQTHIKAGLILKIVGTGPALPEWKAEAARLKVEDRVCFVGGIHHSAIDDFYDAADVFVFPGLRDSGGSSLLEAMSKGLPVVCLDWAGPAEMIDEQSGVKIPVDHPADTLSRIAAVFERLASDPDWRAALGRNAQHRARTVFSWEEKSHLLHTTYEHLLQHHGC